MKRTKRIIKIVVLLATGAFLYDLMIVVGITEEDFEDWVTKMRLRRNDLKGKRTTIRPVTARKPPF